MDSGNESYDEPMPREMSEENYDGSKSRPNVNRSEACLKIHDCIKQIQF